MASKDQTKEADYELVYSCKVNNIIPVNKYKSKKTPLKVVVAEVDGPLVNGYFCLATEAHDDDGLPHTLEHLTFLGSELYPYKGILDILANRCLASGTNAWTDVDHTCYTMTTAGSEGFLTLLPIYIDHILYPLLTEESFVTEIHHINGEGEDAGVVYCEMQGCENTGESKVHRTMIQAMYPGYCGYKSETGGLLKNLRESTTNEKILNYHREFYRPENLTLIISGNINIKDVFDALRPVEERILAKKNNYSIFNKPWQNPVPPLQASIDQLVPYPCEDEDLGMVWIAWRGPSAVYQLYDICALMIFMEYLTDTAISPLQQAFVELPEPYASKVGYSFLENSESVVYLTFENVPVNKLGEIQPRLFSVMEPLGDEEKSNIDMQRMQLVIQRRIQEQLSHLENNPHDTVAFMLIGDVLYGHSNEDFRRRLNQIEDLKALKSENIQFWNWLVKRYLLGKPCVLTQGLPSKEEMNAMVAEEIERMLHQREKLGSEGLAEKECILKEAIQRNEQLPPDSLITSVPIPDIHSITYHPIKRYCNRVLDEQQPEHVLDWSGIPIRFQLDNILTSFVYIYSLMDTSNIPEHLRPYLSLLMECLMESSIERDGKVIPYGQVVTELARDTVKTCSSLGVGATDGEDRFFCGSYCQMAIVMIQLETEKYEIGIRWLQDLLWNTRFTGDRVRVIANKMAKDVARIKRKGNKMALALMRDMVFRKESNHFSCSLVRQQNFLRKIADQTLTEKEVVDSLTQLRQHLTRSEALTIHVAANLNHLTNPLGPWVTQLFSRIPKSNDSSDGIACLVPDHQLIQIMDKIPKGAALSLGSVESSFLIQTVSSIHDYNHPDLAAILVSLQYLSQLEGPFWRQIRRQGLVYGYNLNLKIHEGLLYLSFYRSSKLVVAFKEAKAILESHLNDDHVWEINLLESAKSSLIFELVEKEKTVKDVVLQSVVSYLKNVPHDYNKNLIHKIAGVNLEDVKKAYKQYIARLLDTSQCSCCLVCHPSKLDDIVSGINALGQSVEAFTSLEETCLNKHNF